MAKSSKRLIAGELYSRRDLAREFGITDANLNNGIFKLQRFKSVWLFVTEKKTRDQTQYRDTLRGNDLYMDGQTLGRTDNLIINHISLGLELLLFYRKEKHHYRDFAFRYQGKFRYISHTRNMPKHFHLSRLSAGRLKWQTELVSTRIVPRKPSRSSRGPKDRPGNRVINSPMDLSRKLTKKTFRKSLSRKEMMDLLNERTQAHQDLLAKLYMLYAEAGLKCVDWPFDLLVMGQKLLLLHEVKTLRPRDLRDERRRIREAVGQLAYYEYFDVAPKHPTYSRVEKLVVLQRAPATEHVEFLKNNGIGVIWMGSHGEIQGDENSLRIVRLILQEGHE